jgi:hypothetical protein
MIGAPIPPSHSRTCEDRAMPVFVDRHRVRYLTDSTPLIVLRDVAQSFDLPPLQTTAGGIAPCAGWVLSAGATMCIVDGPGDVGFLLATAGDAEDVGYPAWSVALAASGGAVVIAGETDGVTTLSEALARLGIRGGFIPAA